MFTPGVVIAALSTMFLGAMWYGPIFGDLWLMGHGIDQEKDADKIQAMKESSGPAMIKSAVGYICMVLVMNYLSLNMQYDNFHDGMMLGGIMWVGFALPLTVIEAAFNPRGSKLITLIHLTYQLAYLVVQGGVVSQFRSWKLW